MDMFDLSGHVAVVTGGNRGIGLGLARGLAKAGASVAVWSRDEARNAAAVAELSEHAPAAGFACDVADRSSVDAATAATVDRFGRIDSMFANAGTTAGVRFEEMTTEEWQRVIDVNVTGLFHTLQAAALQMIEQGGGGSLVVTASVAARLGLPTAPHYTASKGAALQLVRSLAVRLARYSIRVNAVSPGWIATEMTEGLDEDEGFNTIAMARTPLRRWGDASDFEGVAVFLASDTSRFMTGADLVIDGGFSAG
jgi:NAD(P)-dependent dehydrogenase (short-subunit alcohol dehydrogenase family)